MRSSRLILGGLGILFTVGVLMILSLMPADDPSAERGGAEMRAGLAAPLRIGLIPELDVFAERRNHRALAAYVQQRSGRRVELVTDRSHGSLLDRFARNRIDAALLDPLVATVAADHCGAVLLASVEFTTPSGSHRAVVFARYDAPLRTVDDLGGRSVALIRSTMAGELYPLYRMQQAAVLGGDRPPELIHEDTPEAVIAHVVAGRAHAGAAPLGVLDAYTQQHPETRFRHLDTSDPLPRRLLVARAGDTAAELRRIVIAMEHDPQGRAALAAFGATRFADSPPETLEPVRRMMAVSEGNLRERLIAAGAGREEDQPAPGRGN
ncbi:MAG: phosphate/phosphite/phosphonate ABC transporter substrate-binding protein [Planctomycetes bacterium]|nr:phosphate/phosphite/phosphonate ABC transporter substrate-binding protein [Planctomycetota bacterium]